MNKILKIITAYFVLPASFLCASSQEVQEEKQNNCCSIENSFGYLNVGIRGPLSQLAPSFGIGYRARGINQQRAPLHLNLANFVR